MNLGIWRLGYYQKGFIDHIYRLVQVSKTWFTHGRPLGLRMAPHGSAWLRMAPHGHKVKTNTSSKFTAPSTNSSTAHMNHDWFSSESRYLARYLDALATECSIVVGWCICPETLFVCHYLWCMWLEYNFVWLLWLCMLCVVSHVQPQEFCRDPVGEGNFTITSDREVAAGVLHSMFTKRLQFHLKRKEFHSCSARDYTATRLFQRCKGATE